MNIKNDLLEQIELLSTVNTVLVVDNGAGADPTVWVATQIEYSSNSSTSSIDYVSFRGYNITAFMENNKISGQVDGINYLSRFARALQARQIISVKFNKNIKYFVFTQG